MTGSEDEDWGTDEEFDPDYADVDEDRIEDEFLNPPEQNIPDEVLEDMGAPRPDPDELYDRARDDAATFIPEAVDKIMAEADKLLYFRGNPDRVLRMLNGETEARLKALREGLEK